MFEKPPQMYRLSDKAALHNTSSAAGAESEAALRGGRRQRSIHRHSARVWVARCPSVRGSDAALCDVAFCSLI